MQSPEKFRTFVEIVQSAACGFALACDFPNVKLQPASVKLTAPPLLLADGALPV
jgi:hypothetical protein